VSWLVTASQLTCHFLASAQSRRHPRIHAILALAVGPRWPFEPTLELVRAEPAALSQAIPRKLSASRVSRRCQAALQTQPEIGASKPASGYRLDVGFDVEF
jgi:hypothetical protein